VIKKSRFCLLFNKNSQKKIFYFLGEVLNYLSVLGGSELLFKRVYFLLCPKPKVLMTRKNKAVLIDFIVPVHVAPFLRLS
jgi:hypothetical protein